MMWFIVILLLIIPSLGWCAPPGQDTLIPNAKRFGEAPSHLWQTQLAPHHYRLCYNTAPDGGGTREDGSSLSDVQCVDFDGEPSTNTLCLVEGHGIDGASGARNLLCVDVVRTSFGPDTATGAGDDARRLGPSAKGVSPERQTQSYELLFRTEDTRIPLQAPTALCLGVIPWHVHACTASDGALGTFIGYDTTEIGWPAESLIYVSTMGIVIGAPCTGTINTGDPVTLGHTLFTEGLLVPPSSTPIVGHALTPCDGATLDFLQP